MSTFDVTSLLQEIDGLDRSARRDARARVDAAVALPAPAARAALGMLAVDLASAAQRDRVVRRPPNRSTRPSRRARRHETTVVVPDLVGAASTA